MKRKIITLLVLCAALGTQAVTFSWDFRGTDGPFDFETNTGEITTNGITMSFSAFTVGDPSPTVNAASTAFGVNSIISGETASQMDADEYITIDFTSSIYTSIKLTAINTTVWGGSDAGYFEIEGESQVALTGNNQGITSFNEVLGAGNTLTYRATTGTFSFSGITVEAVPEPATIAMFGIGALITCVIRRSSRK